MAEHQTMYSPLSERALLGRFIQGLLGKRHQVCSKLQYQKCEVAGCCLRDAKSGLAVCDYKLCGPVAIAAQRLQREK